MLKLLTISEAAWLRECMPKVESVVLPPLYRVESHAPVMLIASLNNSEGLTKDDYLKRLQSLIEWASRVGLRVVVRKHPRETDDFWIRHFPRLEVDTGTDQFIEVLERLRPLFVVSWFSTCLVDALQANVVPVSLMEASHYYTVSIVFNILDHCLLWSESQPVMDALVDERAVVASVVSDLQMGRSGASYLAAFTK